MTHYRWNYLTDRYEEYPFEVRRPGTMSKCASCGDEANHVGFVTTERKDGSVKGAVDDGKTPGKYVPICLNCSSKVYSSSTTSTAPASTSGSPKT